MLSYFKLVIIVLLGAIITSPTHGQNHYPNQREFAPGKCGIEIGPDLRELPAPA
ncbi:MAG: hypothetical protein QNL01_04370 [Akkermansiaceae bacterium]